MVKYMIRKHVQLVEQLVLLLQIVHKLIIKIHAHLLKLEEKIAFGIQLVE